MGERLRWSSAVERLEAARNFWICMTRRDGRPPGFAGAVLSARSDASRLRRLADSEVRRCEPRPRMSGAAQIALGYMLLPRVAQTRRERDYPQTATRWVFD